MPQTAKGKLVTPVGFDPTGVLLPLHFDTSGRLIVSADVVADPIDVNIVSPTEPFGVSLDAQTINPSVVPLPYKLYSVSGVSQIKAFGNAINATTTIYTVTTNKKFYLCSMDIFINNTSAAIKGSVVNLSTSVPAIYLTYQFFALATNIFGKYMSFPQPIEMAAGDTLDVVATGAGSTTYCAIHGYEL